MNIVKYTDYFHDGGILKQTNDRIDIWLESCQLLPEWNKDNIPLSDFQTIKGILHLEGVTSIRVSHHEVASIKMHYDSGMLLNFEIYENKKIRLLITWVNFPPKTKFELTELIEIEAKKILWENIPDLFDPMKRM